MDSLSFIEEPTLRFAYGQDLPHAKDGLTLFGPYTRTSGSVRFGVVGTKEGIEKFTKWSERILKYIPPYKGARLRTSKNAQHDKLAHQYYPGFQAAFKIEWNLNPEVTCEISADSLSSALAVHERHTRVAKVVKVYAKKLVKEAFQGEHRPDLWFVVIPKEVFLLCRPESDPPKDYHPGTRAEDATQYDLFADENEIDSFADEYREALEFKPDFHNQLKARLLKHKIITQVLQEETLAQAMKGPEEFLRDRQDPATIAWNLTTAIYYKTGRRPWILSDLRESVCYIGLVFKRLNKVSGNKNACCGAQMFLEDGKGMVFKGALGPWYSEDTRECHLDSSEAERLLEGAVQSYASEHDNMPPKEIFIHGSVRFNDEEWTGFTRVAARHGINVVGIRIRKVYNGVKVFRRGAKPLPRGALYKVSGQKAYLWTTGFTPRLNTYPGWNLPNPLDIEICNGEANIETVANDIMRLTKLNYNSCTFSDGLPITLKFARKVGDILTTLPADENPDDDANQKPLPFWHYI